MIGAVKSHQLFPKKAGVAQLHRWLAIFATELCAVFLFVSTGIALAQEPQQPPADISLHVSTLSLAPGEPLQALLVLQNTTAFTLTNVHVEFQQHTMHLLDTTDVPTTLTPFSSIQSNATLQTQQTGSQNILVTVQYSWVDMITGLPHQHIETVAAGPIEVIVPEGFQWPDYLIPLVIGSLVSLASVVLTDTWKRQREACAAERQAIGLVHGLLHTAGAAIAKHEKVQLAPYNEALVSGNLLPSLYRAGRRQGQVELPERVAALMVALRAYNERVPVNWTDEMHARLTQEIQALREIIETDR